jgi:hypothetical protein
MPVEPSASRLTIRSDTLSLGPKTGQVAVIRLSTGIESHTSETFYLSYKVATSCVNRCASVRISVRLYFIMSERLIDATSILHYELEAPPV